MFSRRKPSISSPDGQHLHRRRRSQEDGCGACTLDVCWIQTRHLLNPRAALARFDLDNCWCLVGSEHSKGSVQKYWVKPVLNMNTGKSGYYPGSQICMHDKILSQSTQPIVTPFDMQAMEECCPIHVQSNNVYSYDLESRLMVSTSRTARTAVSVCFVVRIALSAHQPVEFFV